MQISASDSDAESSGSTGGGSAVTSGAPSEPATPQRSDLSLQVGLRTLNSHTCKSLHAFTMREISSWQLNVFHWGSAQEAAVQKGFASGPGSAASAAPAPPAAGHLLRSEHRAAAAAGSGGGAAGLQAENAQLRVLLQQATRAAEAALVMAHEPGLAPDAKPGVRLEVRVVQPPEGAAAQELGQLQALLEQEAACKAELQVLPSPCTG